MSFIPNRTSRSPNALAALMRDRRGVTAMTFAILAMSLLGIAALSTEVGGWFLTRGQLQIVADSAAVAGAISIAQNASADPSVAACAVVTVSGYQCTATVASATIVNGVTVSNVQATVQATVTPVIAAMFLSGGTAAITVGAQATAGIVPIGTACALSTSTAGDGTGDMTIGVGAAQYSGSTGSDGAPTPGACTYVSDATDSNAINIAPDAVAAVQAFGFSTPGNCPNCPANPTGRPPATFQPTVPDPYLTALAPAALAPLSISGISGNLLCLPTAGSSTSLVPAAGVTGTVYPPTPPYYYAYCNADVVIPWGTRGILSPGVYLFYNSTLTVQNNATLECQTTATPAAACDDGSISGTGVTLVFTGTQSSTSPGDTCATTGSSGAPVTLNFNGTPPGTGIPTTPNYASSFASLTPPTGPSVKLCPGGAGATSSYVQLSPPNLNDSNTSQNFVPAFLTYGVLIWRDPALGAGVPSGADIEAGIPGIYNPCGYCGVLPPTYTGLAGLQYYPGATVTYGANYSSSNGLTQATVSCSTLVAYVINFQNWPSAFQACDFAPLSYTTPQVSVARVVQ